MQPINLGNGDVYRHIMAGGGGFGNPFERDLERVRTDVIEGKVTRKHAREAYGVVLSDDEVSPVVDLKATESLRAAGVPAPGTPVAPASQRQ